MAEGKIAQLQRARDEAKSAFDNTRQQREALIAECQRVTEASGRAQDALHSAITYADVSGAQAARTRLAELRTRREELQSMIAALGQRQSLLQQRYGDCHDRLKHGQEDVVWMTSRIQLRHEQIRKAQGESSPRVDELQRDLERCEDKFFELTGTRWQEEPVAA